MIRKVHLSFQLHNYYDFGCCKSRNLFSRIFTLQVKLTKISAKIRKKGNSCKMKVQSANASLLGGWRTLQVTTVQRFRTFLISTYITFSFLLYRRKNQIVFLLQHFIQNIFFTYHKFQMRDTSTFKFICKLLLNIQKFNKAIKHCKMLSI